MRNAPALSRAFPWTFDPSRLEALKWAAFGAMVLDHIALFFPHLAPPWFRDVGRFAFPAFAVSFGIGLTFSRNPVGALLRLAVPGTAAQLAWELSGQSPGLNVVLGFGLVGAVCLLTAVAYDAPKLRPVAIAAAAWALLLAVAPDLEGGYGTVWLVALPFLASGFANRALLAFAVAVPALLMPPGAQLALALSFTGLPWHAPRFRWFAWAYAVHLAALVALAA